MTLKSVELLIHLVTVYFYSHILTVHIWCSANFMKPNFIQIRVISFTSKPNVLNYQYRRGNYFILRTDCIKDLGIYIDCKLHFHHHVDFFILHAMKLLGLIRTLTFSFSTIDSLLMCVLPWSDPNWSMLLLLGTLLQLLTPINLSACKENLQPFATKDFFKMRNTIITIYWKN
jgi:hypothetical protein